MSERPGTCAGIISELLGLAWSDNWDRDTVEKAIREVEKEDPNINFQPICEKIIRAHHETTEAHGIERGQYSWRSFRSYTAQDIFQDKFNREEIRSKVKNKINDIDD